MIDKKLERLGEKHTTNEGCEVEIIEYFNKKDCSVLFTNGVVLKNRKYKDVAEGRVKNPYHPSVHGLGCIGQGLHKSKEFGKNRKVYSAWNNMLKRCYTKNYHIKQPSYKECSVDERWHNFQNFAKWCEAQIGYSTVESNGLYYQLDKDILVKGNKVYSPETCCFVPSEVNNLIIFSNSARGEYPVGVTFHKRLKKYAANISLGGVQKHLGYFEEVSEAFNSYKIAKERYIKFVAEKYFGKIGENVYQKLINYSIDTMLMCEVIDEEQT